MRVGAAAKIMPIPTSNMPNRTKSLTTRVVSVIPLLSEGKGGSDREKVDP